MSEELKHKIYSPSDCISEKTMFDYIDHKLSPKERHLVEKHMLDCELCSDAMEGLELVKDRKRILTIRDAVDSNVTGRTDAKIVPFNFKAVFSIAAAVALLVVGVFFFNKSSNQMKENNVAQVTEKEPPAPPAVDNTIADEKSPEKESEAAGKPDKNAAGGAPVTAGPENKLTVPADDYKALSKTEGTTATGAGEAAKAADEETSVDDRATVSQNVTATPVPTESSNQPMVLSTTTANERSKDASFKKSEQQKADQTAKYYDATTAPGAPDQDKPESRDSKVDLANKNAEIAQTGETKGGKYRNESKAKEKNEKKIPKKNSSDNHREPAAGTIAYEPQSAREDKQKVLEEKEQTETVTKNTGNSTVADSLSPGETVYTLVDEMPEYPGGNPALFEYLVKNLAYPATDANGDVAGSVMIEFVVKSNGKAINAKVVKPKNTEFEKQLIIAVDKMPLWKPGKKDGKAVAVKFVLPLKVNPK
ncbi:MAG: energy transducer TonB [Bacteroidia bacterium]